MLQGQDLVAAIMKYTDREVMPEEIDIPTALPIPHKMTVAYQLRKMIITKVTQILDDENDINTELRLMGNNVARVGSAINAQPGEMVYTIDTKNGEFFQKSMRLDKLLERRQTNIETLRALMFVFMVGEPESIVDEYNRKKAMRGEKVDA